MLSLNCKCAIKASSGVGSQIIAEDGITPPFSGVRLVSTLFSGVKLKQFANVTDLRSIVSDEYRKSLPDECTKNLPAKEYILSKVEFQPYSNSVK